MSKRFIIICEGESEWAYLQRLQGFFDDLELPPKSFETPLKFIVPKRVIVKTGSFGKMKSCYNRTLKENKKARIHIWADFDLYHRNDQKCAENYRTKKGIPDFHFSFHNFEDFFALHFEGEALVQWLQFGAAAGQNHFDKPVHSSDYLPEIKRIFPDYAKGALPADFVSWSTLNNLKSNLGLQPRSNPGNLQGVYSFAQFLIEQIEEVYPGKLL